MKRYYRLPAALLLLSVAYLSPNFAQTPNNTLDSIVARLLSANIKLPALFVHIDKPVQAAGSMLWYKVYMYQQSSHLPYAGSSTVYVDLLTDDGHLIDRQLLESTDMRLEGAFTLPRELAGGRYWLKAYTADILLNNPSKVYTLPVYVSNTLKNDQYDKLEACYFSPAPVKEGIYLYVEGESLINGVDNLVAVQALDRSGRGRQLDALVKDNRDSVVARFHTDRTGLGKFSLAPVKGRKYRVMAGSEEIKLPDVPVYAFQLALVKEDITSLNFRVGLSDLLYTKSPSSFLVGISRGRVCFTAAGKGMYIATVPKERLPQGVATFYLFDEKQQLVSQRSIFIEKDDLTITIEPDKKQYMRRATVKLNVTVNDLSGNPQPALLSVAVTDNRAVSSKWAIPFTKALMVNETGNYSLLQQESMTDMNTLLLTQPFGVIPLPESKTAVNNEGIILSGQLLDEKKQPVSQQPISIFSEQEKSIVVYDTTDEKGHFQLKPLYYYDSTQFFLYVDAKNRDIKNWTVKFDESHLKGQPGTVICAPDSALSNNLMRFAANRADSFLTGKTKGWLQTITVKGRKGSGTINADPKRNSFSRTITREQLSKVNQSNTANIVKMIPGVIMVNNRLTIRGGTPALVGGVDQNTEPLLMVDGVQASTGSVVDYLNSILPENIDYIEVLTGPEAAQYGTRSANGVIIIKTGPPGPTLRKAAENLVSIYPKGYHLVPEFYQPDYSNDAIREASFNDNRSTIYWNGNLMTDEKGKLAIQFYSADPRTEYTVTLMGITSKGAIIYKQIVVSRND